MVYVNIHCHLFKLTFNLLGGDEFAALILVRRGVELDAFNSIIAMFYRHLNMLRDEDVASELCA